MGLSPGTRIGQYEIAGSLGAGGMGEVYRATDTTLGRDVAIKTLPAALAADQDRLARFEREAMLLAALNHPHIATIYGLDEHDGMKFLAMELVEGETLEGRLKGGALPVDDALRLALQIAEALEAAHEKGVVHRDLKPANIMLTAGDQVKVLDFGLAKAFASGREGSTPAHSPALSLAMTQQGLVLGTAGYMSPEQASGQATDQRADIWSFGVVLYEMLTGLPLFTGESVPHVLADVLKSDPDWQRLPRNIHPRLKLLLERCLRKKARGRYHSIADARIDIEDILRDPEGSAEPQATSSGSDRARPLAIGLVAGAVVAAAVAFMLLRPPPPAPQPVSRYLITPPPETALADLGGYDVAISPDGSRLAYFAETDLDRVQLYRRDFGALESQPLTGTGLQASAAANMNPFFSPDGLWLGYRSAGQGIMRISVDGGPPLKITDDVTTFFGGSWADDGSLIYSDGGRLYRVSAGGGGTPEPLTPETSFDSLAYVAPVLLPGERGILFSRNDTDDERIGVLDLRTGEERILLEGGLQNAFYTPTGHITFVRGSTLMAVPFDLETLDVTGDPIALIEGVRRPGNGAADYGISNTGTLVYITGTSSPQLRNLVWVDRTGAVVEPAIDEPLRNAASPALSPTGDRVALVTGALAGGTNAEIWVYDLSGRPPIPLASERANVYPRWSPDGTQIAFSSNSSGAYGLHILPADGSVLDSTAFRTDNVDLSPGVWSLNDELILVRCCQNEDIVSATLDPDAPLIDVVVTPDGEYDPALSPNGRWLAYVSLRTDQPEIWVKGYPDGVARRVSSSGGIEPLWSADGTELYFLAENSLMATAVETDGDFSFDAAAALFSLDAFERLTGIYARSYDVSSDGRFLMLQEAADVSETSRSSSIIVVENWFEELNERVPTN